MVNIENLKFGYKKNKLLFDDLNLEIAPGNIYGFLGKNAAGKTSLLHLMLGLQTSYSGTISAFRETPKDRTPSFLSNVYFIPENIFVPKVSILKYLDLFQPFYKNFNRELFYSLLEQFELEKTEKLNSMSHGEQKKVIISFALATKVPLIFMDEPTNGLDIPSKSIFKKIVLSNLSEEQSILIATHQVKDLQNMIDPVVIIDNGKIVFNYSRDKIEDKIAAYFSRTLPEDKNILYSEKTPGGYILISERGKFSKDEVEIDLNILFKAILSDLETFKEIMR